MKYNFGRIEKYWQNFWDKNKTFKAEINNKPKYYVMDMFPYPSGSGLHVGHPLGYIASDIISRFKKLKGYNVLHPMGFDSFGLPAEQYAIKTGQHPKKTTEENIKKFKEQLSQLGLSYDWDREVRTSDSKYYKWTQWIFLKLYDSYYNHKKNKAEKIEKLKKIEITIRNLLGQHDKQEKSKLLSLVKVYESMKPKDAARIFEELDLNVVVDVAELMEERRLAPVLANMDPIKAKTVTIEIRTRRKLPDSINGKQENQNEVTEESQTTENTEGSIPSS